MGMVDFSAYKMNPWDSYEKNREYLLERAGLEEDVAARQQRGDVANRQIALGHEQLGVEKSRVRESGRRTDIMAQEQDRLDRVYEAKQKQAVFEGKRAMFSYLANVPNVANEETWPMFKERIEDMFTEQVKSKGLSPEAERAAINDVLEAIPQTLEEAKSEQSVNELFQLAGESNMEPVFIANPDGSAPEVIMVKKGEGISPEQLKGKIPFKDYPSFSLAKQGYENTVEALSKAMDLDKDRINNYILGFRTLTAPFAEPGEQVTNIFDQGGMPTAKFQVQLSRALKFYFDNKDAPAEEKATWDGFKQQKFKSAFEAKELFDRYMAEPSYVDMLNSRGRGKKAEGPAKDFINQYIKAGGGDGVESKTTGTKNNGSVVPEKSVAAPKKVNENLPASVEDWNVQVIPQNGKQVPVAMIKDRNGMPVAIKISDEEYEMWKKYMSGQQAEGFFKIPTGTMTLEDRSGIFPERQFPH
jgi:hypothetical protein